MGKKSNRKSVVITMSTTQNFVLKLAGPVRLIQSDGLEITPSAAKLKALLVLIGTGNGMRRPRAFLQDMLWSCSDPEKGGASLRQALSAARRMRGGAEDLLIINNEAVALNPARVKVDLSLPRDCIEMPEFAEGLDVADPEFEDWVRDRRSEFADACDKLRDAVPTHHALAARVKAAMPTGRTRPAIVVLPPVCDHSSVRAHAEILTADVATHIAQLGEAEILLEPHAVAHGEKLAVQVRAMRSGPGLRFQVQLAETAVPRIVWIGDVNCANAPAIHQDANFDQLLVDTAAAASAHFGRLSPEGTPDASHLAFQMFAHFPFQDGNRLRRFDAWFDQHSASPEISATQLAWRARLRLVTLLERSSGDRHAYGEAVEFSRAAMCMNAGDPMVTAIAADVALHVEGRLELACELARTSAVKCPRNPFIHAILAQALARAGRPSEGYAVAQRALRLAAGQPNQSWWHAICAATAIKQHSYADARKHAELAHFLAPTFRPPLRFLSALRFHAGDEAGAAEALGTLKSLEPDFCLQRMADETYPVASMRGTELLAVTQSGLL